MSRRNRRYRSKIIKPDEDFSFGPFQIARFGKNIVWKSDWPEGKFDEFQKTLADNHPKLVAEINALVEDISAIVARNPPEELMKRAWWELAMAHMDVEAESDVGQEQSHSMRMVDYIQSMIAATTPLENRPSSVSEEDWVILHERVGQLFQKINFEYSISTTAKKKLEDPAFDEDAEEFLFRARFYWCNVRGERYYYHQVQALRDILLPQSDQIEELYGLTASALIDELERIWHSLIFGLAEAIEGMETFRAKTITQMEKTAKTEGAALENMDEPMSAVMTDATLREEGQSVFGKMFGLDLFDLECKNADIHHFHGSNPRTRTSIIFTVQIQPGLCVFRSPKVWPVNGRGSCFPSR